MTCPHARHYETGGQLLKRILLIPVPPLAEQRRIVAEIECRLSVADEAEAVVQANLRRAVLGRAFERGARKPERCI